MKYIVFLGDGMADRPVPELDGKTPLECAKKPNIDRLAHNGTMGLVKTVADDLKPGSDVANLSVMGYDPHIYYTGRSPLEAASIGVELSSEDVTFRANLVTLSAEEPYSEKTMVDYSSDEITTEEAEKLIDAVRESIRLDGVKFYRGISYRHLMVHTGGSTEISLTPPHDISGRKITEYLPNGTNAEMVQSVMEQSFEILKNHPINLDRIARGLHPANSLWIWGEGRKPELTEFRKKTGLNGTMISAVDLLKGIGKCAGMEVLEIEGATGNIDTNFSGKAQAAIDAFRRGQEFVYIHVEAPDECGHRHEVENKVRAIELIDAEIVGPVMQYLETSGEPFRVLVTPDHPTPLEIMTHSNDPVPFVIYDSGSDNEPSQMDYTEKNAKKTGIKIQEGYTLMDRLVGGAH